MVAVLALALAARVSVIVATPGFRPVFDAADYDRYGASIAGGHGFPVTFLAAPGTPTAFRPPGYPYFLGAVYWITGARWTAGRLAGAFLGVLAVFLIFLVARELYERRAALVAAAIAAVLPPAVFISDALLSETLFTVLLLGAVYAALRTRRTGALGWAAGTGVLIGVAALTRTPGLAVAAVLVILLARRRVAAGAVAAVVTLAVLAPWTLRNEREFHRFVPVSTEHGYTLAAYYNDVAIHGSGRFRAAGVLADWLPEFKPLFHRPGINEAQLDARLRASALRFARHHPGYVLTALRVNSERYFHLAGHRWLSSRSNQEIGVPDPARPFMAYSAWFLLAMTAAGAAWFVMTVIGRRVLPAIRSPSALALLWGLLVMLWIVTAFSTSAPRHRTALDPLLILVGAPGVAALASWRTRRPAPADSRLPSESPPALSAMPYSDAPVAAGSARGGGEPRR